MSSRKTLANAVRALSMDAVQRANSGHPGAPMGMADIAEVLYNVFMRHNPANPEWIDRDRFVMSNGHGSMLPYSVLHLTGYDLSIEDLKNFRQLHSKTPGQTPRLGLPGACRDDGRRPLAPVPRRRRSFPGWRWVFRDHESPGHRQSYCASLRAGWFADPVPACGWLLAHPLGAGAGLVARGSRVLPARAAPGVRLPPHLRGEPYCPGREF